MAANLMEKFLEDRKELPFIKNYVSYSTDERPHLKIGHPAILATFIGYLKFQTRSDSNKEVFFRGQTTDHGPIIPSLLRGDDVEKINKLSIAYEKLKEKIVSTLLPSRFAKETIDDFFQHYGIKSKTLDLVDNIYIAIWFATNKWKKIDGYSKLCTYEPSIEKTGWIYCMQVEDPGPLTKDSFSNSSFTGYCDLRKYHSSLSARLHCQHGITYFKNIVGPWTKENRCFDDLILASVQFPNSEEFKMNGTIFTKEFLFPNSQIDDTYRILGNKQFSELLISVEKEFCLEHGELGQIWAYYF